MQVKPIRNKNDHKEALQRIEVLWGAERGTEDGDLLDVLVTLVDRYEREHFPIDLPDPIEAIKFRLEQGKDYRAQKERFDDEFWPTRLLQFTPAAG